MIGGLEGSARGTSVVGLRVLLAAHAELLPTVRDAFLLTVHAEPVEA